jgi:hypothetical protein
MSYNFNVNRITIYTDLRAYVSVIAMTIQSQGTTTCAGCAILSRLFSAVVLLAVLRPTSGVAQEVPISLPSLGPLTASQNQDQGAGRPGDLLSPQNLLQFEYQVKTAPGENLDGEPDTITTQTAKLRGDLSVDLSSQWQLVFRGDLPYVAKNPISDSNPDGGYLCGLGDADIQGALIQQFDDRWKAGAGVRFIAPTGGSTFGSGKWQVEPVAGFRYALPEISHGSYSEPVARWEYSFTGDPTRKKINNLQFGPMINFSLPDRWFFTLYPSTDIRWNFGDAVTGQTGRLFLPFDFQIGKKFSDLFNVSLEISIPIVKQYPVYNFMTALKLNLTF